MALSKRIHHVKMSGIRQVFELTSRMKDVINLGIGEPDFKPPSNILRDAIKALKGEVRYTSTKGIQELREELSLKLKRENNIDADPDDEIIVTAGATQAIFVAMNVLLNDGDEVLIPTPNFMAYKYSTLLAGGKPIEVKMSESENFRLDTSKLEKYLTKNTKALIIGSPCNPTGAVYSRREVEEACEFAYRNSLYLISDEVYEDFVYDGARPFSPASIEDFKERVITVNSFSKRYAMTGWRVGYAVAKKEIIDAMARYNMYNAVCVSAISQIAALGALRNDKRFFPTILKKFKRRREIISKYLTTIGLKFAKPMGAFYFFPSIKGLGIDSNSFSMRLLKSYKVATIPGSSFGKGGESHIRISYALEERLLEEAMERLYSFIKSLGEK